MFGWLLSWFRKNDDGLYTPKERLIFQYHDGLSLVRADPAVLYRKLMDVGPELNADIALACSPSKAAKPAIGKAEEKVRAIFGLKLFSEGGLGEAEAYELLDRFTGYCNAQKKSLARLPIFFPNTAIKDSSAAGPVTSSSSASGSTGVEPSTAEPAVSPTESKSPSVSTPETITGTPLATGTEKACL